MADKEISDLTTGGTLDGTELVHVVQSSNSRQVTTQDIADLGGGGGAGIFGGFKGFRATTSAAQTSIAALTTTLVNFGTEVFDTESAFASSVFTVPAALDGKYMTFIGSVRLGAAEDNCSLLIQVDTGGGFANVAQNTSITSFVIQVSTGPVLLATGDIYRLAINNSVTTVDIDDDDRTFFAGYVVESNAAGISYTADTTTSYALTNDDLVGNVILTLDNAGAIALTIASGLTGSEPVTVIQKGAGAVTVTPGGGVTCNSALSALTTTSQYAIFTIIPAGSNVYYVAGNLA